MNIIAPPTGIPFCYRGIKQTFPMLETARCRGFQTFAPRHRDGKFVRSECIPFHLAAKLK